MTTTRPRKLGVERHVAHDTSTPGSYIVTMSELDADVCWRLIAGAGFGRIAFVRDDQPWVLPVNCAVVDGYVAFRTATNSMLHQLRDVSAVVFEADNTERVAESGWSVLVRGRVTEITDDGELARLAESDLHPWAPGRRDRWMKIIPNRVSGRVISRGFHPQPRARVAVHASRLTFELEMSHVACRPANARESARRVRVDVRQHVAGGEVDRRGCVVDRLQAGPGVRFATFDTRVRRPRFPAPRRERPTIVCDVVASDQRAAR